MKEKNTQVKASFGHKASKNDIKNVEQVPTMDVELSAPAPVVVCDCSTKDLILYKIASAELGDIPKKLFHITNPKNVESIKKNGLRCSEDGYVYLVEDRVYTNPYSGIKDNTFNEIACGQVFTDKYVPIEVNTEGLQVEGYVDGEYISKWCYCIKADAISPDRLTFGKTYQTRPKFEIDRKLIEVCSKSDFKRPLDVKMARFTL